MAHLIERLLNDTVLGFFALVSLFSALAPLVFEDSTALQDTLLVLEVVIIVLFALEYSAGLVLAPSKRDFIVNPWRVLDALIILAAAISLLPFGLGMLRNSPVLRLLRIGRLALLGTRSSLALRLDRTLAVAETPAPDGEPKIYALIESATTRFEPVGWEQALERIGTDAPDWLFVSGVNEAQLGPIAGALNVPDQALRRLFDASFPRFDRLERFSTFFVKYPLPDSPAEKFQRTPVLLVGTAQNVVVLSRGQNDLVERVEKRLALVDPSIPLIVRATYALVSEILTAYTRIAEGLETSLLKIDSAQTSLNDLDFVSRTFALRTDILRVRGSLKHLKDVTRDISLRRITISGFTPDHSDLFSFLADDAEDLYQGVDDVREGLQALVDLRLNVSSFQMNRVMRLLALLTALALIPATAGGLLGMNLLDTPWHATLAQVSFGVAAGMALSLYVFAIKGWLR